MARPIAIALIGPGLVGTEFLAQLAAYQAAPAAARPRPSFSLVALASSSKLLTDAAGIPLSAWSVRFRAAAAVPTSAAVAPIDGLAAFAASLVRPAAAAATAASHPPVHVVVVDCTASADVAANYPAWLRDGLHVVTPNKKGFSGSLALWDEIQRAAGYPRGPFVFHESTVGAGLPVISTLNDLVKTGDEIVKIEGVFSGTLSFIFNNFSTASGESAGSFSSIVASAKEKGYTEPDPRDDLNGMDVARKVVILGRVAGVPLSLDTLSIENVVPEPLRDIPTAEEFMRKLPDFDAHFEKLNADALAAGQVLRCVGVVDPKNPAGSAVKLVRYPASHPFASMKGSDNIIAFTTKRFPNPLIIQGAGAGAAVTAFGMFSDLLRIANVVGFSA
ncbi:homoserine dehydrogenase-domain-containing protein [Zopfochytrium polystomum]|nr:homoserine dehydrogenase-domain-containing protein [Zopfochytrium polystomum]